nr:AAA family ATPase [Chloroflexota bacterium]
IKGSTELIHELDVEEAQIVLDGAVTLMMDAVHGYEGTVNHVLGDGVMALFGAPIAHEDHAVRACYAALATQDAIRRYSEEVRRRHGLEVRARVGLNSGEVVVRAISNDLRMDYSAMGQTVHLASRMEQLAGEGTIRLTADTLALAEGYVQVRAVGGVPVKGLADPVEVFELVGTGAVRTRLQASAARGLTRFVGRQAEMETIHALLAQAGGGHGQVVALVGEPGVGKSRLVWEVTHSHRVQGWTILESGSVSYGKATSYLPVIDLLKTYCRIDTRDDARAIREKVLGKLLTLDRALESILPALLALLDVPVEDPAWQAFDPPRRRQQTLDGLKRLLLRESQVQPLLLVFEDLHWIDAETQALLDGLIESLPTAHAVLLVNYRPEYRHHWAHKTYYTQLRIDALRPESADELLEALLGQDPSVEPLKQHLIERTEGNPFFLEESVRTLVETGVLVGEGGTYRLAKGLPSVRVPATVQAVLAARIDRLAPPEKRLLQLAAVIGKDVPDALLRAITELAEEELQASLARLQAAEFLYEAGLFPELEYTFKHALTHEVAYGGLLKERRRALHARIAEAIEHQYADRLAEQVERLAQHALRGQVWDKALAYLRQAGARAVARSAHREAVGYFEQALTALEHLTEGPERLEQAIDLRLELRNALFPLGELGRILNYLREAETLAGGLDDQRRLGWVSAYLSATFWLRNDYPRAIESGQRALVIASAIGDVMLQLQSNHRLGNIFLSLGDYPRAVGFLRQIVESLDGDLLRERFGQDALPSVIDRQWLAWCLAELGTFPEALVHAREAVRIAESIDAAYDLILAHRGLGNVYLRKGQIHEAIPALERATALCRHAKIRVLFDFTASHLGYALAVSGRVVDGVRLLEEALQDADATGSANHSLLIAYLGESYLLAGRIEDALAAAGRALALSREHGERGHQAYVLRLLGEIASRREPPDDEQTVAHYQEALAQAEELGMRPLQAHCHLGLGKLYRRIGRLDEARAELATALAMLREMEMPLWLPGAEAELAKVQALAASSAAN